MGVEIQLACISAHAPPIDLHNIYVQNVSIRALNQCMILTAFKEKTIQASKCCLLKLTNATEAKATDGHREAKAR